MFITPQFLVFVPIFAKFIFGSKVGVIVTILTEMKCIGTRTTCGGKVADLNCIHCISCLFYKFDFILEYHRFSIYLRNNIIILE